MKSVIALITIGMSAWAAPVSAESLLFQLDGPNAALFALDSNPVPDRINGNIAAFDNVSGLFGDFAGLGSIRFGAVAENPSVEAFAFTTPSGDFRFVGSQIFGGSLDRPVFAPGSYVLADPSAGGLAVLTISGSDGGMPSTVPEPATWALLGAGLAFVGIGVRRRRGLMPSR